MFCYANEASTSENLHAGEVGGIGWRGVHVGSHW
jgi:hypothetical protein